MKKKRILSLAQNLKRFGGAQKVMLDIHNGVKDKHESYIIGFQKYEEINPLYSINRNEYIRLTKPSLLKNSIILVHGRNVMSLLSVLKVLFGLNTEFIYIAHNVYDNLKFLSFLPRRVVSISDKVTTNLIKYFNIKEENITLIRNGIKDTYIQSEFNSCYSPEKQIKILYSARVTDVKQQVSIVKNLTNKISPNIKIIFAGTGPDLESLSSLCHNNPNFEALGFVSDINTLIRSCHYVMLYSKREGLPISLIEGIMNAKPIIVNNVGGNLEIGITGYNSFLLENNWLDVSNRMNKLNSVSREEYLKFAKNSRSLFLQEYSYDKMINSYLSLISNIK